MILIFGGAYQGKLAYALERFHLTDNDIYRCGEDPGIPANKQIVYEIDKWILTLTKENIDVAKAMQKFIELNADAIVICNDISCGIVPTDALMRTWREAVGRSLAQLSCYASESIRLFCGIPVRVK